MEWLAILIVVLLAGAFVWWKLTRAPKLGIGQKQVLRTQWQAVLERTDLHRKVIEADSVVCKLLGELGYEGSMGDRLKKGAKIIPGLNDVWAAHKLRNRLAHEPGLQPSDGEVQRALRAFARVIDKFC